MLVRYLNIDDIKHTWVKLCSLQDCTRYGSVLLISSDWYNFTGLLGKHLIFHTELIIYSLTKCRNRFCFILMKARKASFVLSLMHLHCLAISHYKHWKTTSKLLYLCTYFITTYRQKILGVSKYSCELEDKSKTLW